MWLGDFYYDVHIIFCNMNIILNDDNYYYNESIISIEIHGYALYD